MVCQHHAQNICGKAIYGQKTVTHTNADVRIKLNFTGVTGHIVCQVSVKVWLNIVHFIYPTELWEQLRFSFPLYLTSKPLRIWTSSSFIWVISIIQSLPLRQMCTELNTLPNLNLSGHWPQRVCYHNMSRWWTEAEPSTLVAVETNAPIVGSSAKLLIIICCFYKNDICMNLCPEFCRPEYKGLNCDGRKHSDRTQWPTSSFGSKASN